MSKYRKNSLLYRPIINWKRVLRNILISFGISAGGAAAVYAVLKQYGQLEPANHLLSPVAYLFFLPGEDIRYKLFAVFLSAVLLLNLKRVLIFAVHVYQCYAPDEVRLACRFTPSCLEYMILSLEKYGVLRGVYKGLRRLARCHAPNGGEDYP